MSSPIFVVGSMRSGSTMLRLILDSHPAIAIGAETGFMGAAAAVKSIPGWRHGANWYKGIGWSETEVDERLREFFAGMFERNARQQGKKRWGDKTPFHTMHMEEMAHLFPDSVFLGIVRHPGGTVASLHDSFHFGVEQGSQYWLRTNAHMTIQGAALKERFALCRYEDLVARPEDTTRQIMEWLGEEWTPVLIEHHKVQQERGTPRLADGGTVSHDAIDPSRAERWRDSLSERALDSIEQTCGPLGDVYGYSRLTSEPSDGEAGFSEGSKLVVTGDDLAASRKAWAEKAEVQRSGIAITPDTTVEEMAERAQKAEAALARVRSRKAVRVSDALKRSMRNRSVAEFREAAEILIGRSK